MKWLQQSGRTVVLAVQAEEVYLYRNAYPWADVMYLPDSYKHHIGKIRRFIWDTIKEPFFWVDDDIRVYLKTVGTYREMFDRLQMHLESGVAMAGIGQQLFCNMQNKTTVNGDPEVVQNKFVSICYAIDPKYFETCPVEELMIYDDVAIVIHAIQRAGTIATYCATQANLTPPTGGCNSWRTKDIIIQDLHKIVELYPDICSIRPTSNTTHSQYIGIGLRTAWSKIRKVS